MSENFKNIVASSPELQARWHAITDKMAGKVRADFGVNLTKEEMADMASVRLAVLSGDESLLSTFDTEIQRHPGVAKAAKERELVRILSDKDDPAHDHARTEWDSLSPHEKIRRAREIDAAKPAPKPREKLSVEEQAQALKDVSKLRGSARIAEARRRGVA